jgi:hypothetical protein
LNLGETGFYLELNSEETGLALEMNEAFLGSGRCDFMFEFEGEDIAFDHIDSFRVFKWTAIFEQEIERSKQKTSEEMCQD